MLDEELRARLSSIDRKLDAMSEQLLREAAASRAQGAWLQRKAEPVFGDPCSMPIPPQWPVRDFGCAPPGTCGGLEDDFGPFESELPVEGPRSSWASDQVQRKTEQELSPTAMAWMEDVHEGWDSGEGGSAGHPKLRRQGTIRGPVSWSVRRTSLRKSMPFGACVSFQGFMHSMAFEMASSFVILLNAGFIGYSASANLFEYLYHEPPEAWLEYAGWAFCVVFAMELLLRLLAEGRLFFIGEERFWNLLDVVLTSFSVVDIVLNRIAKAQNLAVTGGSLLRMSRFVRLFRLVRVMKQFSSLRLVVFAILGSMTSLFWCFFLVAFLIYIFAVLVLYAAVQHFESAGTQVDDALTSEVKYYYGGVYKTMSALFMAISGGLDWAELLSPITDMSVYYGPIFIAYIFFMYFGVLNVVVSAFVATTADVASRDIEAVVRLEIEKVGTYMRKARQFFREADLDRSGTLSWEEFESHLQHPKVKAYFQTLDLDVTQAHIVFELLDVDGSNQVTVDEFLEGCMRLKGQARSVDVNMLLLLHKKLNAKFASFVKQVERDLCSVREHLGTAAPVQHEPGLHRKSAPNVFRPTLPRALLT